MAWPSSNLITRPNVMAIPSLDKFQRGIPIDTAWRKEHFFSLSAEDEQDP